VAGDGPLRGELQEQAATLTHCDVEFVGRLERPEVMSLFDRAKVVVIPSRSEGLPLVALEAQVRGARVICSEIGGLPQAVRKCTDYQFFDPHEIDQITTAIECALTEANADAFVAAAREHVLSQFSPEHIAIAYERVYATAIADAERADR
jgi:glycosyltransferase involved in cell wall biosynthesis